MKTNAIPRLTGLVVVLAAVLPGQAQNPPPAQGHSLPPMVHSFRPPPRIKPQSVPATGSARAGDPLPGITDAEFEAFAEGMAEFNNTENAGGGLGPIFNNTSCVACHSSPSIGGASAINVTRFGRVMQGVFDPLESRGGSLLQGFAIAPGAREIVPPEANVRVLRQTTPLFGLGLVEAIPDETIIAGAARTKPDSVTGIVHYVQDVTTGRIRAGKFGWKA